LLVVKLLLIYRMNRAIIILLVLLLMILQYKLWFSKGGFRDTVYLKRQIAKQRVLGSELEERNSKIADSIKVLKKSSSSIESRARKDLGLIKGGEVFYQTTHITK
jgi:cell division protein FtsB